MSSNSQLKDSSMNIQYSIEALQRRHSVRRYSDAEIPQATVQALEDEVKTINAAYPGVRFSLKFASPEAFGSFKKSYGFFKGVSNYLVAVIDTREADSAEIAGFAGEQFVMLAVSKGLGTCFVAATYDTSKVQETLSPDEKIAFLIPFGFAEEAEPGLMYKMMQKVVKSKGLEPQEFYDDKLAFFTYSEALRQNPWLAEGLQAVAAAPSGMNRQPVRIWMGEDTFIHAGVKSKGDYTDLDLGIAKFNFQATVPGRWDWGEGARFYPEL